MNQRHSQVTRKDIAREAGVSETIVSYVMNNNRYVDKEKRKRVLEAVDKLGYRPNSIARALKGKKLNHILFITDQLITEHFNLLLGELEKNAYDLGYIISLCGNRNTQQFVADIISRCYDGVIISSISFPEAYIQQIVDAGIPVVLLVNRDYRQVSGAAKIDTGLYQGVKRSVRHLYEAGCRNIIYIDRFSPNGHFSDENDLRYRGFVEEMELLGLSRTPQQNVITGCCDPDGIAQQLERYLQKNPVDAILGRNDELACIAMQKIQKLGLRIPEDIKVAGFDNSTLSRFCTPPITSMEIQRPAVAKAAVEMLQTMIENRTLPPAAAFPTYLIERESTDCRAGTGQTNPKT